VITLRTRTGWFQILDGDVQTDNPEVHLPVVALPEMWLWGDFTLLRFGVNLNKNTELVLVVRKNEVELVLENAV
jgi:hypothetical protein